MYTIKTSDNQCFLCTETDTVEAKAKDKTFAGVVCWKHLQQLVKRNETSSDSRTSQPVAKS
ncbi:hypothetical protein Pan258_01580 [Symmachiella dynata]|nr:hypothetical protein Pan258_01580 [Symmachiella dynata]